MVLPRFLYIWFAAVTLTALVAYKVPSGAQESQHQTCNEDAMIAFGCIRGKCLLMALSRHRGRRRACPLLGAKRTLLIFTLMSANDPKRTSAARGLVRTKSRSFWQIDCDYAQAETSTGAPLL